MPPPRKQEWFSITKRNLSTQNKSRKREADDIDGTAIKKEYRKTADAAALGLLLHTALSQLHPFLADLLWGIISPAAIGQQGEAYVITGYLIDIILYLASFFLPALFIIRYSPPQKDKISLKSAFPKGLPITAIIFLGCVSAAGNITQLFQSVFELAGIGFKSYAPSVPHSLWGTVLLFVYCTIIPAFTEEIFFRKILLERLTPYGKNFAVLTAAAAFSLMHAHPSQFLYAFTAGIILGYVTLLSGSLVPAIILHFSNNTLSVVYLLINQFAPNTILSRGIRIFDHVLAAAGVLLLTICLKKYGITYLKDKNTLSFSPYKELIGFFVLMYIAYTIYLSTRWIVFL